MGIIERVSGASASLRFTSVSGFHRNELTWSLLALQFVVCRVADPCGVDADPDPNF